MTGWRAQPGHRAKPVVFEKPGFGLGKTHVRALPNVRGISPTLPTPPY